MRARNNPWLKSKAAKLAWSLGWFVLVSVACAAWFYKAFDTARMLDYLIAFLLAGAAIIFLKDTKEILTSSR